MRSWSPIGCHQNDERRTKEPLCYIQSSSLDGKKFFKKIKEKIIKKQINKEIEKPENKKNVKSNGKNENNKVKNFEEKIKSIEFDEDNDEDD